MKRFIYLAGPITGCNGGEAHDWRVYVDGKLKAHEIVGISPLRCEPLVGERYQHSHADPLFGTPAGIGAKNFFDIRNTEMTFAYMPRRAEVSVGTIGEVGAAKMIHKPVIVITDDPRIKTHPFIMSCAPWVLDTLDQGIDLVVGILGGYCGGKNV